MSAPTPPLDRASTARIRSNGKLRKLLADMRKAFKKKDAQIPYFAVFTKSATISFPPDFSAASFPGLLFCHIVRGSTSDQVITYWRDEEHFKAHSPAFLSGVGLTGQSGCGLVVDLKQQSVSVWERLSLKEWVLGIFALAGAILGIRDYLAVLIAAPDVTISYPDFGRLDVVEGAQISVPVTVWSQVRFASAKVSFSLASMQLGITSKQLNLDAAVLPNLASGQSTSVKITGTAPGHTETQESPDVYILSIEAKAKAGVLWPSGQIHAPSREVWVWRAAPSAPHPTVVRAVGQVCESKGLVYVSKPSVSGLDAEFVLNSPRDVITEMSVTAAANSSQRISQAETASTTTRKIAFRTPPFDKFQEYHYNLILYSSKAVARSDCETWVGALEVNLQEARGEK